MQRPLAHVTAVGLLVVVWLGLMGGIALVWQDDAAPFEIFAGAFWSLVWFFWLARIWLGGPMAIGLMRKALFGLCPILIFATGLAVGIGGGEVYPSQLVAFAVAVCGIFAGVLLMRGEVQRWSLATVAVRVVRQPPDGTAFDLRSAALRQSRGKFGCLMIVVTVLMLLVVGAIGATLPADRGTDAPDYIAFMVGVVLVVLAGIAGYVWIDVRARAMGVLTVTDRHLDEHPWSRVRSVALSYKGEAAVVNGVRRHRSARLDLSLYDEPDPRRLRLPDDAALHGSIAAALAAHSPEGVFRGWVSRTGATTSGQVNS
ncbi:hypothetical protein [Nonomuraea fuscirosea]|uniref:hypothetical protein n=1 Tax=Nonomuraea fuscirosea TaxID=1291556 RepID=UPI00343E46F3